MSQHPKMTIFVAPRGDQHFLVPSKRYISLVYENGILNFEVLIVTMATYIVYNMFLNKRKSRRFDNHPQNLKNLNFLCKFSRQDNNIVPKYG